MKRIKRIIPVILALVLIFTCIPVQTEASTSKKTVMTQSTLEAALKNSKITSIKISTKAEKTLTIPEGDYSNKSLSVVAGNVTLNNNGVFKKITVVDADTVNECVSGNTVVIKDKSLNFNVKKGVKVKKVTVTALTDLYIGGTSRYKLPITVKSDADGSDITASITVSVSSYARIDLILNAGAEKSTYTEKSKKAEINVINNVKNEPAKTYNDGVLTYQLNADGTGYTVTDCDIEAETVNIPAKVNGLPVKELAGRAFINCSNLGAFTTDWNQQYFYADEHGVLYTDSPVKTLVRFPNNFSNVNDEWSPNSYVVSEGTVKIGDYAFAGLTSLRFLHIPEGVQSIGDYAFTENNAYVDVFVPDSINEIGKNILQNQLKNLPFYGDWESYAAKYAMEHMIPFGGVFDFETPETTVKFSHPTPDKKFKYTKPAASKIRQIYPAMSHPAFFTKIDIGSYQQKGIEEVKLLLERGWEYNWGYATNEAGIAIYPDREGVYGYGYTASEAIIIGYDKSDNITGTYHVNGDFIFSLPGAVNIGVAGGSETLLNVVPYEPIFIKETGTYRFSEDELIKLNNGRAFVYFVIEHANATSSFEFANYQNMFSFNGNLSKEHYCYLKVEFGDETRINQVDDIAVIFDYGEKIYEKDDFVCIANHSYCLDSNYGKKAYEVLQTVKETMIGTYYPKGAHINKITLNVNGEYPTTDWDSNINLDKNGTILDDNTIDTLAHEMTHAVDMGIAGLEIIPDAWFEGRAVYVEEKVMEKLGLDWYNSYADYNWAFLSDEDKADFFRFYYFSTNRQTPYGVGYYFMKYINSRYGENISATIMENIGKLGKDIDRWETPDEVRAELFKKAVTSATSENVFQDFVRDVIH